MKKGVRYAALVLVLTALLSGLIPPPSVFGLDSSSQVDDLHDYRPIQPLLPTTGSVDKLSLLAARADLIAYGQVLGLRSYWRDDGLTIESEIRVALKQSYKGAAASEISIRSPGGFLAAEGIGMIAPHEASFVPGEELFILAQRQDDGYVISGGAVGKYGVYQGSDLATLLDAGAPLSVLLETMGADAHARQQTVLPSPGGSGYLPAKGIEARGAALASRNLAAGMRKWQAPDTEVPFRINANTRQVGEGGSIGAFRSAIIAAAEEWNRVSDADFKLSYAGSTRSTRTGYNGVNEILFMNKGSDNRGALAQVWYRSDLTIVEADIWINDDYEWNVGGESGNGKLDLQSALVHEFGHWLILNHSSISGSVMAPTLAPGIQRRNLHGSDAAALVRIYPF